LNCGQSDSWCIDKDKLTAFGENSGLYRDYWSVASIEVLMVYPPKRVESVKEDTGDSAFEGYRGDPISCPAKGCDFYVLYDNGQRNKKTYSAYVNVCQAVDRSHEICELGKLLLGVKI